MDLSCPSSPNFPNPQEKGIPEEFNTTAWFSLNDISVISFNSSIIKGDLTEVISYPRL